MMTIRLLFGVCVGSDSSSAATADTDSKEEFCMSDLDEVQDAMEMLGKGYNNDPIPDHAITGKMSGFTPAPDILIHEYGFVTALIWGIAWRYCQMSDNVCRASKERIADRIGMSERTVIRHLNKLCEGKYLVDTTPDLANKPHIYADPGKLKIRVNVEAGVTQSHSRVTESQGEGDRESGEESIKKDNQESFKEIIGALEKLTGGLNTETPRYVDVWLEKHEVKWIMKAIEITRIKGARIQYADAILEGWKDNGYPETRKKPAGKNGKTPSTQPQFSEEEGEAWDKKYQEIRRKADEENALKKAKATA